ncbi:hypothetical protein AGMMS50268_26200 [Spirochaetia bacterium]|nr:hypothetical protein AGMMS50268_26200 [Spirochaetia bacterium]
MAGQKGKPNPPEFIIDLDLSPGPEKGKNPVGAKETLKITFSVSGEFQDAHPSRAPKTFELRLEIHFPI